MVGKPKYFCAVKKSLKNEYGMFYYVNGQLCHDEDCTISKSDSIANEIEKLPIVVLERTLSFLNIWYYKRLRECSPFFSELVDNFIMHLFRRKLCELGHTHPNGYQNAILNIIKLVSEYYLQAGYQSTFCGCLLQMLREGYTKPFCPDLIAASRFILHFLIIVDDLVRKRRTDCAQLLYTMTLFRILLNFKRLHIKYAMTADQILEVCIKLEGPWIVFLRPQVNMKCNQRHRCALLMILCELLLACNSGCIFNFRRLFQCDDVFNYGSLIEAKKPLPVTVFNFKISGSEFIQKTLINFFSTSQYEFEWPTVEICKDFQIHLAIASDVMKIGRSRIWRLHFPSTWE